MYLLKDSWLSNQVTVYIKSYNYLSNITLKTLLLFISHNEGNKDSQNDLCSHAVLYLYSHLDIRPEFLKKMMVTLN